MFRARLMMCALLGFVPTAFATEIIKVATVTAEKPPIIIDEARQGLTHDLIEALNELQDDYFFQLVPLPTQRFNWMVKDSEAFDMMAFANLIWLDELKDQFEASQLMMRSREFYVALAQPGRDQTYFQQIGAVKTIGVRGYHYAFAGFENDEMVLSERYNLTLVKDEATVLQFILMGRSDIGIVEDSTLFYWRHGNPDQYRRLLISDIPDNEFDRNMLLRKGGPIDLGSFNGLLQKMRDTGVMQKVYGKYGLQPPSK